MDAHDTLRATDLDTDKFPCCPNVDPRPFKCASCGHPMVYCDECDSVFLELRASGALTVTNANALDPARPALACSACGTSVEWTFRRNPDYDITHEEWLRAGLGQLLRR